MRWLWGLVVLGAVLLLSAGSTAWQTWKLASRGVVKRATVERTSMNRGVQTVEVLLVDEPGAAPVKLQWPSSLELPAVGRTIDLRVLPDSPDDAVPAEAPADWTPAALLTVLGLAFATVPAVVRALGRRRA
ncbi:MAG: hypothetical protein JNJ54_37450 [Myxococcaceae bacterium]|nr:hypothetical protein [Myxococcaceae bacterium]